MKFSFRRLFRQSTSRREKQDTVHQLEELREFVYLDEVSVVSLLSSRLGKLPSEFTETLSDSSRSEINASIDGNAGFVKSQVGSRMETAQSRDTQVVSKATIQATFRRLYFEEIEAGTLAILPSSVPSDAPTIETTRSLLAGGDEGDSLWVLDPRRLHRGQLAEFEVELLADETFQLSTILATYTDIVKENQELFGEVIVPAELERGVGMNQFLEKMLAGLVPLKCRLVDYVLVGDGADASLVHRRVLEQIPGDDRPESKDAYLVGVTEKALYWKDLRRLLFGKDHFRVLCRLSHDGLTDKWTPVTLAEVLGRVSSEFVDSMDFFGSGALEAIATHSHSRGSFVEPRVGALMTYGGLLAEHVGYKLTESDRRRIEDIAITTADLLVSVSKGRQAFAKVARYVGEQSRGTIDPTQAAEFRVRALHEHNLYPDGTDVPRNGVVAQSPRRDEDQLFLNAEIIAIYW